ncbi:MAG: hypothetical protein ABIT38_05460 [Gemmatimonadaceae bacterium]
MNAIRVRHEARAKHHPVPPIAAGVRYPPRAKRQLNRKASTLIELVVALLLTAIIAAAALRLVDHTNRFTRGTTLIAEERSQIAATSVALRNVIAELSADGIDLQSASDSSAVWLGTIGLGVACRITASTIDLPPEILASRIALTSWSMSPQPGDAVAILDEGSTVGSADDRWHLSQLVDARTVPNGCSASPFVSAADAGKSGWRLQVADSLPPTIVPGAAVRIRRLQRLALYRSASLSMLGWTDWNFGAGFWNTIQPLAGPLQPYAPSPGASGISLAWFDSLGAVVPLPSSALASARATVRGRTAAAVRMTGAVGGVRQDSLGMHVPLRNRR